MIKQIYIMRENGILLYQKAYQKNDFDNDLLTGFFASIANFSREALQRVIQNIDLGEESKLILYPERKERIIVAAIVAEDDNNQLVLKILKNICQDFIDIYSPDYRPNKINYEEVNKIIEENIKGKTLNSFVERLLLLILVIGPLSVLLYFISNIVGQGLFIIMNLEELYNLNRLFDGFLPAMFIISAIVSIILFLLPNFLLGFILFRKRAANFASLMYIVLITNMFFLTGQTEFGFIILSYMPMIIILSILFIHIGHVSSGRRRLTNI